MQREKKFFNPRITLRKLMLIITLFAMAPVAVLWFVVTQPILPTSLNTNIGSVEPARLETHVRMLTETFFPRSEKNPKNLDRVAGYIREEFERVGAKTVEQPYEISGVTYRNVIAHFGPETEDRIIVGAHYDAYGELPGADDNASAVAALIELAYLLKYTNLKTHVELVAFTLEEPPYFGTEKMGSAIHASSLKRQNSRVRIMISLEMIGYFSEVKGSQGFPAPILKLFYPSKGDFIAVVGKLDQIRAVRRIKKAMRVASPLPVYSMNAPVLSMGIDFSDHRSYWEEGYEAVMITDTAFYRNKNYHTVKDTPDTLDYSRMAMVVKGVYASVLAFND